MSKRTSHKFDHDEEQESMSATRKDVPSINFLINRRWSSRIASKPSKPASPQKTSTRDTPFLTEGDSECEVDADFQSDKCDKSRAPPTGPAERRKPARAARRSESVGEYDKYENDAYVLTRSNTFRKLVNPANAPFREYEEDDEQSEPNEHRRPGRSARGALWADFLKNTEYVEGKPEAKIYNSLADVEVFAGEEALMRVRRQADEADTEWAALKSTLPADEVAWIEEAAKYTEHNYKVDLDAAETLLQLHGQSTEEVEAAPTLLQLNAREAEGHNTDVGGWLAINETIDSVAYRVARNDLGKRGLWYREEDGLEECRAKHRLRMMIVELQMDGEEELAAVVQTLIDKSEAEGRWGCSRKAVALLKEAGELVCQYQVENLIEEAEEGKREVNWRVPPNKTEQDEGDSSEFILDTLYRD